MKRTMIGILCVVALLSAMIVTATAQIEDNTALLSHIAGDVDGNWELNSSDVRAIFCVASGERANTLSSAADANADGTINMSDAYATMRTALGKIDSVLVKPTALERETAPEGEAIEFVIGNTRGQYGEDRRYKGDVWIVQSYDELKASFEHSNAVKDYTAQYRESFFEEKALIIWASELMEYGLMGSNVPVDRLVKNGNELCMVRKATIYLTMPYNHFERHMIEIDKADLIGIDTVTFYTEYEYKE